MTTFLEVLFLCQPASPDPGSERHWGWHPAWGQGLEVGTPAAGKESVRWLPASWRWAPVGEASLVQADEGQGQWVSTAGSVPWHLYRHLPSLIIPP